MVLFEIAKQLQSQGLIRSASSFKLYAIISGNAHRLKPGLYAISSASTSIELVRSLVAGPAKEINVLISEGKTMREVDEVLAKHGIIKRGELVNLRVTNYYDEFPFLRGARSFEGFLFPDTYRFFFESSPDKVVRVFLKNFSAKVSPLISDGSSVNWDGIPISRRGIFNITEIITIASMIEKEVPDSAERRLVADIIYRRLKISMPLQIDATVDYAEIYSERYNTYKHAGLPPGPIANPGLDAIEAVLNPRASNYLYYLSDPKTNKTIFSRDFEEHKENKLKYLR